MNDKSKLSSRFKRVENPPVQIEEKPAKLVLPQKKSVEIDLLKKELYEKIDSVPVWFEYSTDEQKDLIKRFVSSKINDEAIDKDEICEKLSSEIQGFGAVNNLLQQENVSAVLVNGTNSVYIEISGRVLNTEIKLSEKELAFLLNSIYHRSNVDNSSSIVSFKAENLFFTVIKPEIAVDGFCITIRKQSLKSAGELIKAGMLTDEALEFILSAINQRKNIVISGDINIGKSTMLDMLINSVIKNKRSVLLEKIPYLISESDSLVKFICDKKSESYNDLLSEIMKMNPDYIVTDLNSAVCELSDMKGLISTLRAAAVDSALMKLTSEFITVENLPEKYAKAKVLRNFDYIVHITKEGVSVIELTNARTAALSVKRIM